MFITRSFFQIYKLLKILDDLQIVAPISLFFGDRFIKARNIPGIKLNYFMYIFQWVEIFFELHQSLSVRKLSDFVNRASNLLNTKPHIYRKRNVKYNGLTFALLDCQGFFFNKFMPKQGLSLVNEWGFAIDSFLLKK
jgi:hypothetical protein